MYTERIKDIITEISEYQEISEPLSPESPPAGAHLPCVCPLSCASSLARQKVEMKRISTHLYKRKSDAKKLMRGKDLKALGKLKVAFTSLERSAAELEKDRKLFLSKMDEYEKGKEASAKAESEVSELERKFRGAKEGLSEKLKILANLKEESEICSTQISRLEGEAKYADEGVLTKETQDTETAIKETEILLQGLRAEIESLKDMIGNKTHEIMEMQAEVEPQQTALDEVQTILEQRRKNLHEKISRFERMRKDAEAHTEILQTNFRSFDVRVSSRARGVWAEEEALRAAEATMAKAEEGASEIDELNLENSVLEEQKRMLITKILETSRTIARTKRRRESENIAPKLLSKQLD